MILHRCFLFSQFERIFLAFLCIASSSLYSENCDSLIFDLNKPFRLESGWKFRKGDNLDWKEIQVEESFWIPRSIPDYGISKTETIAGFHWYRCKFLLPENFNPPDEPLGIRLGKLRDIDETFFNGYRIGKTGALSPTNEPDFHKERIYPIPSQYLKVGENVIAIRLYASGVQQGLKIVPLVDKEKSLYRALYSENVLAIGFGYIFVLMGLYFLTGAFIRGLRRENIFFGLFSIFIGFYTLVRSQYRYEMFTSFTTSYTFELLSLIVLPILFINFLISHLNAKRNYLVYLNEGILGVLFFITIFTKSISGWNLIIKIFNYSLPLSIFITGYYLAINFKMNYTKIKFILIGLLGLFPTIVLDSLSAIELIQLDGTLYFGFLFFLVFISIQLSEEMLSSLQKFILLEAELIRMERIKTGFLVNISNEFKTGTEKITQILEVLKDPVQTNLDEKHNKSPQKTRKRKSTQKRSLELKSELENLAALVSSSISMVEEAILLRKLEEGQYFPEYSNFSINEVIYETLEQIKRKTGQNRKKIYINIYPKEAIIHSDKRLISAILRNLIENAFQYTDKSVRIDIDFQISNNNYTLSVADEGSGMSISEQENLFKKFVRGLNHENVPGAGIGLTLCRQAAIALGGDIKVRSQEGLGSVFTVTIPVGRQ